MKHLHNIITGAGLLALLLAFPACTGSDFSGGSSKSSSGKKTNGPADAESGDANDGVESDAVGAESDIDGTDSSDADGTDTSDATDATEGADIADGDDVTKQTRTDLKIKQTAEDDDHRVKVELLIKGKISKTEEVDSPGLDKEIIMKDMCRKGLDTCIRVTFIGEKTQVAGGAPCVFTTPLTATSVKLDVDTNGGGLLGSCAQGKDEVYEFSCNEAKSLKVQACNG